MDKNLISIDDLVRQRLSGGEEQEREGAWSRMRDLLDTEMPKKKAFGFGFWKRAFMMAGIFFLSASITFGGYELTHPNSNLFGKHRSTAVAIAENALLPNETDIAGNSQNSASAIEHRTEKAGTLATNSKEGTKHSVAANLNENSNSSKNRIVRKSAVADNQAKAGNSTENSSSELALAERVSRKTATSKIDDLSGITKAPKNIKTEKVWNSSVHATNPSKSRVVTENSKPQQNNSTTPGNASSDNGAVTKAKSKSPNRIEIKKSSESRNGHSEAVAVQHKRSTVNEKRVTQHKDGATIDRSDDGVKESTSVSIAKSENESTQKIDKIMLNKRYVASSSGSGHFTFDTISRETLYEQLHSLTQATSAETSLMDKIMKNAVASNSKDNTTEESSESTTLKATTENKTIQHINKHKGSKVLENLSEAFNEIKINASGVKFVPGLAAGANGTFFGPTSFYGFDFGVTGSLNFGDNFSLVSELKYFHRINGDYQLNDDYYFYEANNGAGGGWKKIKMDYDFSFSTLHSFELPVAFHFIVHNFSVFAGANFLYTFGINTGAAPLADPVTPVQIVQSKGNDDHPTLNYNDFGQRFGIGYLFGFGFKLRSNMSMDIRSVQTVWDNAKSQGAKAVSNTLYKSPSIQLQLNYQLGKNKSGEEQ